VCWMAGPANHVVIGYSPVLAFVERVVSSARHRHLFFQNSQTHRIHLKAMLEGFSGMDENPHPKIAPFLLSRPRVSMSISDGASCSFADSSATRDNSAPVVGLCRSRSSMNDCQK
jgi:hypothetical protein